MGRWVEDYGKSSQGFYLGLLLVALGVYLFALIGFTEVRFSLKGLREVHGEVIEAESHKSGRRSGYWLIVKLWDSGYALIALLGGLYLVGRHLLQHSDDGGAAKEEGKSA